MGKLHLNDDLDLDALLKEVAAVIVMGDLVVKGNIKNLENMRDGLLQVQGKTAAKNHPASMSDKSQESDMVTALFAVVDRSDERPVQERVANLEELVGKGVDVNAPGDYLLIERGAAGHLRIINARQAVYGDYNDNVLYASTLRSKLVIEDDHSVEATVGSPHHFDMDRFCQGNGDGLLAHSSRRFGSQAQFF